SIEISWGPPSPVLSAGSLVRMRACGSAVSPVVFAAVPSVEFRGEQRTAAAPLREPREPSDVTVLPKEPAVLDCLAHGQPPVTVKWLKDGAAVAESDDARLLQNGSLRLASVRRDAAHSDEGLY
ncbi:hypothetical protein CRUP_022829, partial [Coryphaenoides rupestris]